MDDYKKRLSASQRDFIVNRLRRAGFLRYEEGWTEWRRYVLRLLYYPRSNVRREIQQERLRISPMENQIGVHLRCGGFLADVNEDTAMITPEILTTIPGRMLSLMNSTHGSNNHTYFYLSTDSSVAAKYVSNALQPIAVKSTILYRRGHTSTGLGDDGTISRALLELHLVSQSRALLLTSASTFSQMVSWMSTSTRVMVVHAPYTHTNATWGRRIA